MMNTPPHADDSESPRLNVIARVPLSLIPEDKREAWKKFMDNFAKGMSEDKEQTIRYRFWYREDENNGYLETNCDFFPEGTAMNALSIVPEFQSKLKSECEGVNERRGRLWEQIKQLLGSIMTFARAKNYGSIGGAPVPNLGLAGNAQGVTHAEIVDEKKEQWGRLLAMPSGEDVWSRMLVEAFFDSRSPLHGFLASVVARNDQIEAGYEWQETHSLCISPESIASVSQITLRIANASGGEIMRVDVRRPDDRHPQFRIELFESFETAPLSMTKQPDGSLIIAVDPTVGKILYQNNALK